MYLLTFLLFLLPASQPAQAGFCSRAYHAIFSHTKSGRLRQIEARLQELDRALDPADAKQRLAIFREQDDLWNDRAHLSGSYQTVMMKRTFLGEDSDAGAKARKLQRVGYFSREYRAKLEVHVDEHGQIRRADGSLFSNCPPNEPCRPAIFVMDADGRIFVYDGPMRGKYLYRHSSILAGGPVASAGEIEIRDGRILRLSPMSGHYVPAMEVFVQVLRELGKRGVPRPNVHLGALWML